MTSRWRGNVSSSIVQNWAKRRCRWNFTPGGSSDTWIAINNYNCALCHLIPNSSPFIFFATRGEIKFISVSLDGLCVLVYSNCIWFPELFTVLVTLCYVNNEEEEDEGSVLIIWKYFPKPFLILWKLNLRVWEERLMPESFEFQECQQVDDVKSFESPNSKRQQNMLHVFMLL